MRGLLLLVAGAILVAGVAIVGRVGQSPESTAQPGPSSAIEACQLPALDVKAGATITYDWQVAVRLDSPAASEILFISGPDVAQCEAYRGTDGTYTSTTVAVGRYELRYGTKLTYDTGASVPQGGAYASQLVIGQVPLGTASVDVLTTDGEHHSAAIGNGWYMALATISGQNGRVVGIDALDSAGKVIASLADPSGLLPGAPERPFSS